MKYEDGRLQINSQCEAAAEILACYATLAEQEKHLLSSLLHGSPIQWVHYPVDDVIDHQSGYQYFYHSHSPEDREGSSEHGHFHLFARLHNGRSELDLAAEQQFIDSIRGGQPTAAQTINLLCISLDAKGVPTALFTVNRWVTGDHFFDANATLRLLARFKVEVHEYGLVNQWLTSMIQLFWPQIEALLLERDAKLWHLAQTINASDLLDDTTVEVLSSVPIDINGRVAQLLQAL